MAREFTVSGGGITLANQAVTLVFLNPPAAPNFNIENMRYWISQAANATSAQQRVSLINKASQFPTLTGATPSKLKPADPNASVLTSQNDGRIASAGINASAENGGAVTSKLEDAFNVLNGWLHVPTPPESIIYPAGFGNGIGMYLPVAAATLTNWAFGINFREV